MQTDNIALHIENISFKDRLFEINLKLPQKGIVAVIGPNGAGKSTLLQSVAGIIMPNKGRVLTENNSIDLLKCTPKQRAHYLSYLAQDTPTYWDIDVSSLIKLGLLNRGHSRDFIEDRLETILLDLNLIALRSRSMMSLSGGERARIHLARALMADTPILLADEPITSLDPFYQLELLDYLKNISNYKLVLVVLHDLMLTSYYANMIVLMDKGSISLFNERDDVLKSKKLETVFSINIIQNEEGEITAIKRLR